MSHTGGMTAARKAAYALPLHALPGLAPTTTAAPDAHLDTVLMQGQADKYHGVTAELAVPPHVARNGGRVVYQDVHPDGSRHAMYVYDGTPPV